MRRRLPLPWSPSALGCVALAWTAPVWAQRNAALSGDYGASPAQEELRELDWPEGCGPLPQPRASSWGPVSVTTAGSHLVLRFPDRELRTDRCWSDDEAMALRTATAAAGKWRLECQARGAEPGDQELAVYSLVVAEAGNLELRSDTQIARSRGGARCSAAIRVTQQLLRTQDASCLQPGAIAAISLRPRAPTLEPGERVCFRVQARDRSDCPVPLDKSMLEWRLRGPAGAHGELSGGCFQAAETAAEATGMFVVSAAVTGADGPARTRASITVKAPDLSAITAARERQRDAAAPDGGVAAEPADLEAAAHNERTALGGARVSQNDSGWTLVIMTALSAALLAGVAATLSRRRRARRTTLAGLEPPPPGLTGPAEPAPLPASSALPEPSAEPGAQGLKICPQCRRGYAAAVDHCLTDQSPLLPYDTFLQQARAEERVGTCPSCGARLQADSAFCSSCGRPTPKDAG